MGGRRKKEVVRGVAVSSPELFDLSMYSSFSGTLVRRQHALVTACIISILPLEKRCTIAVPALRRGCTLMKGIVVPFDFSVL